jgi:hypothetical protein
MTLFKCRCILIMLSLWFHSGVPPTPKHLEPLLQRQRLLVPTVRYLLINSEPILPFVCKSYHIWCLGKPFPFLITDNMSVLRQSPVYKLEHFWVVDVTILEIKSNTRETETHTVFTFRFTGISLNRYDIHNLYEQKADDMHYIHV